MTVKYEKVEENKVKLTVTVEKEVFNNGLDVAFKKIVKDVNVPGFRKGKVPRFIFEKKFGVESLYEEAINFIINNEYPKAVEETKIEPVAQPTIDVDFENIGKDKPFTFFATVVVKPEVKLGQYKEIEVKPLSTEVTEEDIDKEIKQLLEQHSELVIKEGEAELGDTVIIDYEGSIDNKPFEGGKANNYSLKLGSNSFIPGFEDKLVGIKPNEERTITVKFPDDYHAEDLKGKEAQFKVKCHEVKELEIPELNEDFIKELNRENINTVEELREDFRKSLVDKKEEAAKNHIIDTVVETAANNADINIPEEMIETETNAMLKESENRLKQQGIDLDLYLKFTGGTIDSLKEQLRDQALKRIRYNLTLEQIAKEENIEATEEDIENEFNKLAENYNMPVEQVKSLFPDTTYLKQDIQFKKAVDFLVDNVKKVD